MREKGLTTIELVVALLVIVVLAAVLLPALSGTSAPRRRPSCQNNLKQLGLVCKMYANECPQQLFPPVQGGEPWHQPGAQAPWIGCGPYDNVPDFAMLITAIHPEYLTDLSILICPSSVEADYDTATALGQLDPTPCNYPQHVSNPDVNYIYFGYCIDKGDGEEETSAPSGGQAPVPGHVGVPAQTACVVEYIIKNADDHAALDQDIDASISGFLDAGNRTRDEVEGAAENMIYRLREGIDQILPVPPNAGPAASNIIQSKIPIMWDTLSLDGSTPISNHTPPGANCLFMDGHVEFIGYPGRFPCSEAFAAFWGSTGQ